MLISQVVRVAVVACVCLAGAAGALKLDDTLGVLDLRADRNSSFGYLERTYPSAEWVAGDPNVIEAGRLRMPRDATYRVVLGPGVEQLEYSRFAQYFLLGRLLPRKQVRSASASWVFCYGCSVSTLGRDFKVLAGRPPGLVFGRLPS